MVAGVPAVAGRIGWRTSRYSSAAARGAACVQAGLSTLWQDGMITLGTQPRQPSGAPDGPVVLRPATEPGPANRAPVLLQGGIGPKTVGPMPIAVHVLNDPLRRSSDEFTDPFEDYLGRWETIDGIRAELDRFTTTPGTFAVRLRLRNRVKAESRAATSSLTNSFHWDVFLEASDETLRAGLQRRDAALSYLAELENALKTAAGTPAARPQDPNRLSDIDEARALIQEQTRKIQQALAQRREADTFDRAVALWDQIGILRDRIDSLGRPAADETDDERKSTLDEIGRLKEAADRTAEGFPTLLKEGDEILRQAAAKREEKLDELAITRERLTSQEGTSASGEARARLADIDEQVALLRVETGLLRAEFDRRTDADIATSQMVPSGRDTELASLVRADDSAAAERLLDQRQRDIRAQIAASSTVGDGGGLARFTAIMGHELKRAKEDLEIFRHLNQSAAVRALRESQLAALIVVERRARAASTRDRQAAADRLLAAESGWMTNYPRDGDALDDLLSRVHADLRARRHLSTNIDVDKKVEGNGTVLDILMSRDTFPNFWEIEQDTDRVKHAARRGAAEEYMGYAATVRRDRSLLGTFQGTSPSPDRDRFAPDPSARLDLPNYAALLSSSQPQGVQHYGYASFVWKRDVLNRSTFTPADSLDNLARQRAKRGPRTITGSRDLFPLLAYGQEQPVRLAYAEATGFAYDTTLRDELASGTYRPRHEYFEAQVHGTLTWQDLDHVTLAYEENDPPEHVLRTRDTLESFARRTGLSFTVKLFKIGDALLTQPDLPVHAANAPGSAKPRAFFNAPSAPSSTRTGRSWTADTGSSPVIQGPGRRPHIDTDSDGTQWASSTHSADTDGERACVEVTMVHPPPM